jgi:pimeloyl-ACP methyl ester carboxylesterase
MGLPRRDIELDSSSFGKVRIAYRELGEGPPLVLVHGLMTSSYSWRYVIAPLAERFRVLVPDLPGAGDSDKPVASYRIEPMADLLAELIEAWGVGGCRVIGNSLGGYLSMWTALRHPDAMTRLVNIHSPGIPLLRLRALRLGMGLPGSDALLSAMIRRNPERWVHDNVHYYDETLKSREETREYARPLSSDEGRRAFGAYLRETLDVGDMGRFEQRLKAAPFPIPLQLVYARRDPMVPPDVGRRLAELLPAAELVWLEGVSHFMHVDQPELVLDTVLPFLTAA